MVCRPRRVPPLRRAALLLAGSGSFAAAQTAGPTCALPVSPPPDQTRVVFLLDTSGSMAGQGDSVADIFAKVKGAILRGTRATTAPGTVEIDTFDRGPQQRASFLWPGERAEFERTVNSLEANGANTWLYRSMQDLFSRLAPRDQVATTVYVVTDGRDNDPSRTASIRSALDAFNLSRGPFDKLYYVALGISVPQSVKQAFADTTFAQALELPPGQAPDFTAVTLTPGLVTVGPGGSFPYRRPAGTTLQLESGRIGDAAVTIRNPNGAGERVDLEIQGTVPAGSVGYMCAQLPGARQNVLLRFDQDTPRRPGSAAPALPTLGSLVLLNPDLDRVLSRGERAVLHYRAAGGPVTVEVAAEPPELSARLPDQTVSLLEGERVDLTVTDRGLTGGQEAAPSLRLNDRTPLRVPSFVGEIRRPFPWWWLLLLLLPLLCLLFLLGRRRRRFDPYALSVNRALVVFLHDRHSRRRRQALLRRDQNDIGELFREDRLRGLVLERYRPEPEEWAELDNSDMNSIRQYAGQRLRRAARLLAQPETLRLHKRGHEEGTFLQLQEMLALGQLYVFTDYAPPRVRQRPPLPPPEPPIDVIVSLLDGPRLQELELPLDDVDLADVFGNEDLRGLIVRREPGLLRLRALRTEMRLRHISREFYPGEALPLAVMLDLGTGAPASGSRAYQVRIRDRASSERYRR
ncbi:von Willebrand factor, type A [Deinococcus phoenicis]|uniref:von Willebrand factor, type A n=1 Tax=Deinococcus phoenicis TaxID=1476583 RepID=A0A016QTE0_9DEIO|nr:vWA domain-containing protein [Deinococcus phoenicis]EYB69271.1 von Willebrand factor, type A [Deinococcus phoenicis]